MSTFYQADVACPHCGDVQPRSVAGSINATRSPQYRDEILTRTFQRPTCGACRQQFLIEEPFIYIEFAVDGSRGLMVAVHPANAIDEWRAREGEVLATWHKGFGPKEAPAVARALGEGMAVRTVFGLEALREKIVCAAHGVDDARLEATKLALIADGYLPAEGRARLSEVEADGRLVLVCEPTPDPEGGPPRQLVLRMDGVVLEQPLEDALPAVQGGSWVDAGRALRAGGVGDDVASG